MFDISTYVLVHSFGFFLNPSNKMIVSRSERQTDHLVNGTMKSNEYDGHTLLIDPRSAKYGHRIHCLLYVHRIPWPVIPSSLSR